MKVLVAASSRHGATGEIADEIAGYVVELGTDGRLLALQLEELMAGVDIEVAAHFGPAHARLSFGGDAIVFEHDPKNVEMVLGIGMPETEPATLVPGQQPAVDRGRDLHADLADADADDVGALPAPHRKGEAGQALSAKRRDLRPPCP